METQKTNEQINTKEECNHKWNYSWNRRTGGYQFCEKCGITRQKEAN